MDTITVVLPCGHSEVSVQIPSSNLLGIYHPQDCGLVGEEIALLQNALAHPINSPRLRDLAQKGQTVAIITSDMTRPCPSEKLLSLILKELSMAGILEDDITIVMALGLHRSMSKLEIKSAVGNDIYRRISVINHDPLHTARIGITSAGTPVEIFRPVIEADLRICLGNLELHYFAGFSGGAKAILPGCASEATIRANHAMMVEPAATTGRVKGNPVRADFEEGVGFLGVDFILNVLVNQQHHIIKAVAGDVITAHRQGCEFVAQRCMVPMPHTADIVLVSAGGHPKDVNLYQAQKALDNATNAVRAGGIIVLVVECCEGYGNQTFESWMKGLCSPDDVLARIQDDFVLGGHKAAAFARVLKRADIYLVSTLQADSVQHCGMEAFNNVAEAIEAALSAIGPEASVVVLPQGGSVLPVVHK